MAYEGGQILIRQRHLRDGLPPRALEGEQHFDDVRGDLVAPDAVRVRDQPLRDGRPHVRVRVVDVVVLQVNGLLADVAMEVFVVLGGVLDESLGLVGECDLLPRAREDAFFHGGDEIRFVYL